jgi:hypothetical protein
MNIRGHIFWNRLLIQRGMSMTFFSPCSRALQEKERHGYFIQDSATAHTADYSIKVLNKVAEERMISHRLWPVRSPDLYPYDFYLWGNLKSEVYSNNPHTFDELKHNICETITSIKVSKLKLVSILSKDLKLAYKQKGDILSIYCDCTSLFIMYGTLVPTIDSFFSADDR